MVHPSAEGVELADTPSLRVAVLLLYERLLTRILPFASITFIDVQNYGARKPRSRRIQEVGAKSGAVRSA